jgi:hypothetical protein
LFATDHLFKAVTVWLRLDAPLARPFAPYDIEPAIRYQLTAFRLRKFLNKTCASGVVIIRMWLCCEMDREFVYRILFKLACHPKVDLVRQEPFCVIYAMLPLQSWLQSMQYDLWQLLVNLSWVLFNCNVMSSPA